MKNKFTMQFTEILKDPAYQRRAAGSAETYPIPPLTPARTEFSVRTGIAGVGAVCPAAEIDANEAGAAELVQPIVHAPADAGAVEEHRIGVVQIDLLHDSAGDLHEVRDAELHGRDRGRRARGGSG